MTKKYPGLLITFEGGEGGGKTTQVARLEEKLHTLGKKVVALREPGGTVVSEQIREVVLSAQNKGISYTTEVLLFQAARAQIYQEVVVPALTAGKIVVMDRSRDSSVVYQGIVRNFGKDLIEELNDISTQQTYPDLTVLLDVPVEIGLKRRVASGEVNRLDLEHADFHEKVRKAYVSLAKEDTSGRWQIIDASQPIDEITAEIFRLVTQKLA